MQTHLTVQVHVAHTYLPCAPSYRAFVAEWPLVTCVVRNRAAFPVRATVSSCIESRSSIASTAAEVPAGASRVVTLAPRILERLNADADDVEEARVRVSVEHDGADTIVCTRRIFLLPRNIALLACVEPGTWQWRDLRMHVAAFVTPTAPIVQALARKVSRRVFGTEDHRPGRREACDTAAVLKATFDVIRQYRIRFSQDVPLRGIDAGVSFQRVQLPREMLQSRSGNCLDGTVLFASVLEALSIGTALVAIPGHAVLGWRSPANPRAWCYFETTLSATHRFVECVEVATCRVRASRIAARGTHDSAAFALWPISRLRRRAGIFPLE